MEVEKEYYQSSYTGEQIDKAIGRIVNGEIDQIAEEAATSAGEAKRSAEEAAEVVKGIEDVSQDVKAAQDARDEAVSAASVAYEAASAAETSATNAALSESRAASSAGTATTAARDASDNAEAAAGAAASAAVSAEGAGADRTGAENAKNDAQNSAGSAAESAAAAAASAAAARAAQTAAEEARDAASEIAGGDYASKKEAQDYASAAESNAKTYTKKHIDDKDNPHGVTAKQVGAVPMDASGEAVVVGLQAEDDSGSYSRMDGSGFVSVDANGHGAYFGAYYDGDVPSMEFYGTDGDEQVRLRNIENPVVDYDAANKKYVDETRTSEVIFNATVTTAWTKSGSYYYQDIAVSGITAEDDPTTGINPGSDNAANLLYDEAFGKVFRITTSENSIRVWATEKISTAFPIRLKVVK